MVKLKLKLFLMLAALMVGQSSAWAAFYIDSDGVKWNYEIIENTNSVRIVQGSEFAPGFTPSTSINIPATFLVNITTYTVTEIGDGVFNNQTVFAGLTSVTIPASVTSIGAQTFKGCTNLTTVVFDGDSQLSSIGASAFYGCTNLSSITLPNSLQSIGNFAFYQSGLTSIVVPNSVMTFGNQVFRGCSSLQSAVIGNKVSTLDGTFIQCSNLEEVVIGSDVTSLTGYTFYQCTSLADAYFLCTTIPEETGNGSYFPSSVPTTCNVYVHGNYGGEGTFLENYTKTIIGKVTCDEGITAATATLINGSDRYFAEDADVTLSYTGTVSEGYTLGYTVTKDDTDPAVTVDVVNNNQFTMPDCDVTVSATYTVTTSSVEADGTAHEDVQAILLDNTMTTLAAGTYVVNSDVTYTNTVTITGDVTLILADGYTMNIGTSESRINGKGIKRSGTATLTIYGQSASSGALSIYTTGTASYGIWAKAITIDGGHITVDTEGVDAFAFYINNDCTINGGTVTASATSADAFTLDDTGNFTYTGGIVTTSAPNGFAIFAIGNCNFSWRNASDCITISAGGLETSTAIFNSTFTDGNNTYSGTLTGSEINALAGKTLYPYIEELDLSANLAPDGNYWTTFYCSHTNYLIDEGENATAYTAEVKSGSIKLHSLGKDVPKNTAVIIKGEDDEISMTKCEDPDLEIPANDLDGVDVQTATSSLGDGTLYVLGKTTVGTEEHFGFHKYTGTTMAARKAFLLISGGDSSNFFGIDDETTGIHSVDGLPFTVDSFFDLSGRKVTNPTKGLYIVNGKKVVYNR